MALSNISLLKEWLEIPADDTTRDSVLIAMLAAADRAVKEWCHRDFESQAYTQFYSGNGRPDLLLKQRPVSAVASLYLDSAGYYGSGTNAFAAATLLTAGGDYALVLDGNDGTTSKSGTIRRIGLVNVQGLGVLAYPSGYRQQTLSGWDRGNIWPLGDGNIKVTYTAGYAATAIPDDLRAAVHLLVAELQAVKGLGKMLQQESYIDYSYSVMQGAAGTLPEMAEMRMILASYRDVQI